jgi:hypothetical protein
MLCGQNDYVIGPAYRRAQQVIGMPRIDQTLHIISKLFFAHRQFAEEGEFFALVLSSPLAGVGATQICGVTARHFFKLASLLG